jgi:hypothetical protein
MPWQNCVRGTRSYPCTTAPAWWYDGRISSVSKHPTFINRGSLLDFLNRTAINSGFFFAIFSGSWIPKTIKETMQISTNQWPSGLLRAILATPRPPLLNAQADQTLGSSSQAPFTRDLDGTQFLSILSDLDRVVAGAKKYAYALNARIKQSITQRAHAEAGPSHAKL